MVPPYLNYQGVLADAAGDPLPDGDYSVTFRIWDGESGGTALWAEGRLVTVGNGLFNVLLGSVVPIPDSTLASPDRWLGVQVGLDPEMQPRTRLVTVPYAWHSGRADNADTAKHSLDKTIDASELTVGDLDTARFSAYDDLFGESRIGDQAGQVAAGDHVHMTGSYRPLSAMNVADNTVVSTGSATFTTVRSLSLASGDASEVIVRFNLRPRSNFTNGYCTARILFNGVSQGSIVSPVTHSDPGGFSGVYALKLPSGEISSGGLIEFQLKVDGGSYAAINDYWEVWGR